jgi:predicted nucleic acid-binding protein
VLVDSWAWLALYNENDSYHDVATLAYNELLDAEYVLVTTNSILSETYTNLRRWASHSIAIRFGRTIQGIVETGALEIVRVTAEDEAAAWEIFEKYDDLKDLSFTDCTTFAVMQRLGVNEAFTGDKHFTIMGLVIHP